MFKKLLKTYEYSETISDKQDVFLKDINCLAYIKKIQKRLTEIKKMKKLIILSFITLAISSCKDNDENKKSTDDETQSITEKESTSSLETGCYSYNDGKSIINFEITKTGNQINGNLTYELDEKDSNKGTFTGNTSNDKLFGIYTFESEGVESSREVAFMIKDNLLIEGYGELNESGNAFKDKKTIKYLSKMPLKKTDCNK